MSYFRHGIALIAFSCASSALLYGQVEFGLAGRKVQVHGFASQSFMYSHQNNFASMKTSDGSFGLTDGGLNMSTAITDKFRIGAQMYVRHMGDLSDGVPELDWAFADAKAVSTSPLNQSMPGASACTLASSAAAWSARS